MKRLTLAALLLANVAAAPLPADDGPVCEPHGTWEGVAAGEPVIVDCLGEPRVTCSGFITKDARGNITAAGWGDCK